MRNCRWRSDTSKNTDRQTDRQRPPLSVISNRLQWRRCTPIGSSGHRRILSLFSPVRTICGVDASKKEAQDIQGPTSQLRPMRHQRKTSSQRHSMSNQIKSNEIYLQAQNMKEKQMINQKLNKWKQPNTNWSASRTQKQRTCSNMPPPKKSKRNIKNTCNLQHETLDKIVRTST